MNPAQYTAEQSPASGSMEVTPAQIDINCRLPVMLAFVGAAVWGVVGAAFGLVASIKFHSPNFLADPDWLTYGRVWPAARTALLYGFCIPAGLGTALWMLARLGRTFLAAPLVVMAGGIVWNIGVALAVGAILTGNGTGYQHLQMPGRAGVVLFVGYAVIAAGAALTFHARRIGTLFVSHWFLFTALFWFAWIFSTAQVLLVLFPTRGVMQAVIDWWFSQNLRLVWLDLIGLAALFYFVPKLYGRELYSRPLALFTYWCVIVFAPWGGIPPSAPAPAWLPALSTAATGLSAFIFITVALNLYGTFSRESNRPAAGIGPFFVFSAAAFVLAGLLRVAGLLFDLTEMLQFTFYQNAVQALHDYGFFSVAMLGAIHFVARRLFAGDGDLVRGLRLQFWSAALGTVILVVPLAIAGLAQAVQLAQPSVPFARIIDTYLKLLRVSTLGDLCILLAQCILLLRLVTVLVRHYRAQAAATYAVMTEPSKPAEVRA